MNLTIVVLLVFPLVVGIFFQLFFSRFSSAPPSPGPAKPSSAWTKSSFFTLDAQPEYCTIPRLSSFSVSEFLSSPEFHGKPWIFLENSSFAPPEAFAYGISSDFPPSSWNNDYFRQLTRFPQLFRSFLLNHLILNTAETFSHRTVEIPFIDYICQFQPISSRGNHKNSENLEENPSSSLDEAISTLLSIPPSNLYYFFGEHEDFRRPTEENQQFLLNQWKTIKQEHSPWEMGKSWENEGPDGENDEEKDLEILGYYCQIWKKIKKEKKNQSSASEPRDRNNEEEERKSSDSSHDLAAFLTALDPTRDPLDLLSLYCRRDEKAGNCQPVIAERLSWASLLEFYRILPHAFALPFKSLGPREQEILWHGGSIPPHPYQSCNSSCSAEDSGVSAYLRPSFLNSLLASHSDYDFRLSFGLGGGGSGVPFHFHGAAFAEVLHGSKRWFLYPPKQALKKSSFDHYPPATLVSSDYSALSWLSTIFPQISPRSPHYSPELADSLSELQSCTLYPGEILFIPSDWLHLTMNLEPSVFISIFMAEKFDRQKKERKIIL